MVEVSILLLTKNGCGDLGRLLPAVFHQAFDRSFEVIAIDSGSTDGTLDLLGAFPVRIEQILRRFSSCANAKCRCLFIERPNYCFSFARRGSGFSDLASHLGLQL